ncbi:MAG: hypothetical protein OQJ95_09910, partial [Kangiella sp.]|nr:hypothetical protein [Kangiella sp.]
MQKRVFLISLVVFFLSACAPSSVVIKPEDKQGIRTIAILQIDEPHLRMMNLGSGMAAFGAIGGAAIAASEESERLSKVLKKEKFSFSKQITNDLHKQLRAAGYKTTIIKVSREDKRKLLEDYSKINVKADAIMDVVVSNSGYVTEHFMFSPHWRPEARAFVVMVNAK